MKQTKLFRALILVLAMLLVFPTLSACKKEDKTPSTGANGSQETADPRFEADDLPADLSFNDAEVRWMICSSETDYNMFHADESTVDYIEGELYKTATQVESRLNISLAIDHRSTTWGTRDSDYSIVCYEIINGVCEYDMITSATTLPLYSGQSEMVFKDISQLNYINLEKPWWTQNLNSVLGDEIYFVSGDGYLGSVKNLGCVFFNQNFLDAHGVTENMYELAENGEWTLEKMELLTKDMYISADGTDSQKGGDSYGVTFGDGNKYTGLIESLGIDFYTRNSDNCYTYAAASTRVIDIMDTLRNFNDNNLSVLSCIGIHETEEYSIRLEGQSRLINRAFSEGRAAFTFSLFDDAKYLYNPEAFKLGLLPYPKYDVSQEYRTAEAKLVTYIPMTAKNADMSAAVLEAWSSQMYRSVIPAYFESVLQLRYSADTEMSAMFDMIRESRAFSISSLIEDPDLLNIGAWSMKGYMTQSGSYGSKSWNVIATENELIAMAQLERIGKVFGFSVDY